MKKILLMASLFSGLLTGCGAQTQTLKVGDAAPFFSLKDQKDSLFNSRDYLGKKVLVIFFYPKDESAVCTKEACSFRDSYTDFVKAGALVVGINAAGVESHRNFAQNHQFPFVLLSDPGNKVLKMFGVKDKFFMSGRETFVVDRSGKIVFTYDSFIHGKAHEQETLKFIQGM
jgi:thioredoxin-dependent peroxiredoxin